jgi:hypothetical protein
MTDEREERGPLPPEEVGRALEAVALHVHGAEDVEDTLLRLTVLATQMVAGCDVASLSLLRGERLETVAATEEVARRLDAWQYEDGEGPCVDSARAQDCTYVADLVDDTRWPVFSRLAAEEFGRGSVLSCQLTRVDQPDDRTGALNMYARRPDAFTESDGLVGLLLAAYAGALVDAAKDRADLHRALASRDVIGQAKGILMARRGLSDQEAFDELVQVSQRLNIKLREVARLVSDGSTGRQAV